MERQPKVLGRCKWCYEDIVVGDEIVELEDDMYHSDCFSTCAPDILVEQFGATAKIAEEDFDA